MNFPPLRTRVTTPRFQRAGHALDAGVRRVSGIARYEASELEAPDVDVADGHVGAERIAGCAHFHAPVAFSHQRIVFDAAPEYDLVADHFMAEDPHRFEVRFVLPHAVRTLVRAGQEASPLVRREAGALRIDAPGCTLAHCDDASIDVSLAAARPTLPGAEDAGMPASKVARWRRSGINAAFRTIMYPHDGSAPSLRLRPLPYFPELASATGDPFAIAFEVSIGAGAAQMTDTWFVRSRGARGPFRFGSFRYDGWFAFVRENAFGEVVHVRAEQDACLSEGGFRLMPFGGPR